MARFKTTVFFLTGAWSTSRSGQQLPVVTIIRIFIGVNTLIDVCDTGICGRSDQRYLWAHTHTPATSAAIAMPTFRGVAILPIVIHLSLSTPLITTPHPLLPVSLKLPSQQPFTACHVWELLREGCFRPRDQTSHLAECQWYFAPMTTTWRKRFGSGSGRRRKDRRNTRKGTRQGTEGQGTNTQAHDMDDYADEVKRARADT